MKITYTLIISKFQRKLKRIKHFGFSVIFWIFLDKLSIKNVSEIINIKKHKIILNWIVKNFKNFIQSYKVQFSTAPFSSQHITKKIWICWWDGFDVMPPIVKACYNSVLLHADDYNVILITKYNYTDYLSIPVNILEKVNKNIITITHLSDIIRISLLYTHGGLWLDSTVLVTNNINFNNISFFTIHMDYGSDNVSKKKWNVNCIGTAPNNLLFKFIFDFFCNYWNEYDDVISYHLFDYSIALAYNSFIDVKNMFDSINLNNKNYMIMQEHLNEEFALEFYQNIIRDTIFHKLNWRKRYLTETSGNKLTIYGHILDKYLK